MNSEDRVLAALKALGDQERGLEAPARVEARLRAEFRRARAQRSIWRVVTAAGLAAGAVLAVWAFSRQPEAAVPVAEVRAPVSAPVKVEQPAVAQPQPVAIARPARKAAQRAKPAPVARMREVATEFFPLVDIAPPFESGQLLRVIVPASTMRTVGLPVREDRWTEPVHADILYGQEGIARAIRFVRYEQ